MTSLTDLAFADIRGAAMLGDAFGPGFPAEGRLPGRARPMFKFLHAADIHLDSPLKGLDRYEGCPSDEIRGATRRALDNLVKLAIEEEVAFVLIAGDVYDGDWKDHNTGLWFVRQMARLRDARIPVFLIRGNHDAQNKMTALQIGRASCRERVSSPV